MLELTPEKKADISIFLKHVAEADTSIVACRVSEPVVRANAENS